MATQPVRRARQGFSRYECIGRVIRANLVPGNGNKTAVLFFDVILSNIEGSGDNRTEVPYVANCKTFGRQAEFLGERWQGVDQKGATKPRVHIKESRPTFDPPKQMTDKDGRTYNVQDVTYIVPPFGVDFLDAAPQNGAAPVQTADEPEAEQADAPAEVSDEDDLPI